jgi:hypothetical protein
VCVGGRWRDDRAGSGACVTAGVCAARACNREQLREREKERGVVRFWCEAWGLPRRVLGAGCPGSLNRGACGRDLRAKFARARRQLGTAGARRVREAGSWAIERGASGSWAVRPGSADSAFFFNRNWKYYFGGSKIIGKIQMRYCWIRYEKYFNMRSNLRRKRKP